jgi:hypothetical protein
VPLNPGSRQSEAHGRQHGQKFNWSRAYSWIAQRSIQATACCKSLDFPFYANRMPTDLLRSPQTRKAA